MSATIQLLQFAALGGAIYCGLAYVYGFIVRPKGNRPLNVASLMLTGIVLLCLAAILPSTLTPSNGFAFFCATLCLIASVGCQSLCAFRGRASDRAERQPDQAESASSVVRPLRRAA